MFGTVVAVEVVLATWWLIERVPVTEGRGARAKQRVLAQARHDGAVGASDNADHERVE